VRESLQAAFIAAACVPRDAGHASGTLERAEAILASHPEIAGSAIHTAALLGDEDTVRRFLERDPASATAPGGPYGWDALTHLCFSRYLRLDAARSDGFVRTARALLDAGASATTGWFERDHQPRPEWESALYGAAGVAHHAGVARLLLERGADPNDGEVTYHTPETSDLGALKVLVESGRLTADSLATMLLRKADWHDTDGIRYLLEHGADPNWLTHWGYTAAQQAVRRDNALVNIDVLLDHGADPKLANGRGETAVSIAIRRGRGDVLAALERRGVLLTLEGMERLLAACARGDEAAARLMVDQDPALMRELRAGGGTVLAEFAGVGNMAGVRLLLDLGVDVTARYAGDAYFGIAAESSALHVAAWRAWPEVVHLLIEREAPVDARDARGQTPLALAVRACVDSYWTARRSPDSVAALLAAGASVSGVPFPSGYAEVDALLRRHGAQA
jgi:ankyrin repeat protein